MPLTPQDFVSKWKRSTGREKQTHQQHFLDLCELVGHPTPAAFDPTATRFGFEMGAAKTGGGTGWANAAKIGYFGWEYNAYRWKSDLSDEEILEKLVALNLERSKQEREI